MDDDESEEEEEPDALDPLRGLPGETGEREERGDLSLVFQVSVMYFLQLLLASLISSAE